MKCRKNFTWHTVLVYLYISSSSSWIHRNDAFLFQTHSMSKTQGHKSNMVLEASSCNRRTYLKQGIAIGTYFGISVTTTIPLVSSAEEEEKEVKPSSKFNEVYIQDFLKDIPTFTIVDAKGVPFAVVGEDAKLSSYFFTSYAEADRILKLASSSADRSLKEFRKEQQRKKQRGEQLEEDTEIINPWKTARISTVPLDFGVTLANRGKIKGGYFRIAAREQDIEDAMDIERVDDLAEGKVPLFYYEDFEIPSSNANGEMQMKIPLFFEKDQLIKEWKKRRPKGVNIERPPPIKVTELFSILGAFVRATEDTPDVEDLSKLMLIPPADSTSKAQLCKKRGGSEQAFKLGERIIVL